MAFNDAIIIENLDELTRAFSMVEEDIGKDLREGFRSAAEPVRSDAEARALTSIRRMTIPWSRMRVGITRRWVYVAPNERGVKSSGMQSRRRPNLAGLLRDRALDPAAEQNIEVVERETIDVLNDLARAWSRV